MQIIRKIKDEDLISTNFCRLTDYQKKCPNLVLARLSTISLEEQKNY